MRRCWAPVTVAALILWALVPTVAAADTPPGQWPVTGPGGAPPTVSRGFDPPAADWLPGHRGVDLTATAGAPVRAAADGRITHAGPIAGRGVVVVDHGSVRTTYEPVTARVRVGTTVRAGEIIGHLEPGHCAPADCLHWGLRAGDNYLNPLSMVSVTAGTGPADVRLLPGSAVETVRERARQRAHLSRSLPALTEVVPGAVGSHRPADGPVTSPFGMRTHPVTGIHKLHDGVDIGASCGSPIRSVAPGRVRSVTPHPAYGWWLIIDHGTVDGRQLSTGYAHASAFIVAPGTPVAAGQHLGAVGTTGWSTGCHLHFMVWVNGRIVDPSGFV